MDTSSLQALGRQKRVYCRVIQLRRLNFMFNIANCASHSPYINNEIQPYAEREVVTLSA